MSLIWEKRGKRYTGEPGMHAVSMAFLLSFIGEHGSAYWQGSLYKGPTVGLEKYGYVRGIVLLKPKRKVAITTAFWELKEPIPRQEILSPSDEIALVVFEAEPIYKLGIFIIRERKQRKAELYGEMGYLHDLYINDDVSEMRIPLGTKVKRERVGYEMVDKIKIGILYKISVMGKESIMWSQRDLWR